MLLDASLCVGPKKHKWGGQHPAPHLGLLAPGGADIGCLLQPAGKHVGGKHARGRVDTHQQTCRAAHAPGTHTVQQPGPTRMPPAGAPCPGGGSGAQVPRGPPNRRGPTCSTEEMPPKMAFAGAPNPPASAERLIPRRPPRGPWLRPDNSARLRKRRVHESNGRNMGSLGQLSSQTRFSTMYTPGCSRSPSPRAHTGPSRAPSCGLAPSLPGPQPAAPASCGQQRHLAARHARGSQLPNSAP